MACAGGGASDNRVRASHRGRAMVTLGQLVATAGVAERTTPDFIFSCVRRHASGDWGELLDAEDRAANDAALSDGGRLLSAYPVPAGQESADGDEKIWIITEWDRSVTTVLYPSEY